MRHKRTALAVAISLSLSACVGGGGGGGGGGSSATLGGGALMRPDVPFHTPTNVNVFRPNVLNRYHVAEVGIFARDLNQDGADEVMTSAVSFNGAATQATWNSGTIQVFGWNTGRFTNETQNWFHGISNQYVGGSTIRFGDFNRDGHLDAFAAAFTDNPAVTGPSVMLLNTGNNRFTRVDLDLGNVGAHDTLVHDFNQDGISDIWLTDIIQQRPVLVLGSTNGQFTAYRSDHFGGAAGISVADFLGDGSRTVVMTDGPGTWINGAKHDTMLFGWQIQNDKLVLTEIGLLPPDRFYLPKWDAVRASTQMSPHAVRNLAFDFDRDGKTDVVVFSTMPKNGNVHGYSEVQFLRNTGGGNFTDVTDSVLAQFDHNKTTSYNPQLVDVNNDGLLDILITATDYTNQPSTAVLLATKEGRFVESFLDVFSDFSRQARSLTTGIVGSAGEIAILVGPENKKYLFTTVETEINGLSQIKTWLSLIGSNGTVTPQATINAVKQAWPWMSPAEVNTTLQTSVSQWIDGVAVLDPWAALAPIGGLGISLDGRKGTRLPITGGIWVPGLDPKVLSKVTAVDGLGRDFQVDLSGMAVKTGPGPAITGGDAAMIGHNWSTGYVGTNLRMDQGFDAQGAQDRWTMGTKFPLGDPNYKRSMSVSMSRMPGSPWLSLGGVWGHVKTSTMIDAQVTQRWDRGFWGQAGVFQTTTDLTPGMVSNISPIWAAYSVAGWTNQGWSAYGGLRPTIFSGSMDLRLPGRVDNRGVLHYSNIKVDIRNPAVAFAGIEKRWQSKNTMTKISTQFTEQNQYKIGFDVGVTW